MVAIRLGGIATAVATGVVAAAVASALSCGGGSNESVSGTPNAPGAPEVYRIPPSERAAVLAMAGEGEVGFLKDGAVTFGEYEQALFNLVRCGEEGGLSFGSGPKLRKWGEYQFEATWPASFASGQGILDECRRQHYSEVQRMWARVAQPSEKDYREAYVSLSTCLREAGLEVAEQPSGRELAALGRQLAGVSDEFSNCAVRMQDTYGIYVTERGEP